MSKAARQRYDDVLCVAVCEITNIQADLDTVMFESQVLSHVPSATDAAAVAASGTCPNKPVSAAVPPANQSHQSSAAQTEGASPSNSSFWTASTEVNVASYLNSRFNGEFEEHTNYEGRLMRTSSDADQSTPWEQAHHFVSAQHVVKVYRILWSREGNTKKVQKQLAQALHESAATAFICQKRHWLADVFGFVVDQSNDSVYLHICLLRTRLDPKVVHAQAVSGAFVELLETTGVMHGDGHVGNVKFRIDGAVVELLDFERSFLIESSTKPAMIQSIRKYAEDSQSRRQLLTEMASQGLDATRNRFITWAATLNSVGISGIKIHHLLTCFQQLELSSVASSSATL